MAGVRLPPEGAADRLEEMTSEAPVPFIIMEAIIVSHGSSVPLSSSPGLGLGSGLLGLALGLR